MEKKVTQNGNELYHYGVKGMRWKDHKYVNSQAIAEKIRANREVANEIRDRPTTDKKSYKQQQKDLRNANREGRKLRNFYIKKRSQEMSREAYAILGAEAASTMDFRRMATVSYGTLGKKEAEEKTIHYVKLLTDKE